MAEILLTPFLNKNLKFFNRVFYHSSQFIINVSNMLEIFVRLRMTLSEKNKFLPGEQLNKPHRSMLNAIRTTIDRELSKRTREFFPACGSAESVGRAWKGSEVPRKITARSFLAKFEFLTPKDLEAAVITSEEHRLGTTSR